MNILITGGSGYIGNKLSKFLIGKGDEIHLLARTNSAISLPEISQDHIHRCDGGGLDAVEKVLAQVKPNLVIHLASLFIGNHQNSNLDDLVDSNINFGCRLLQAMSNQGITNFINTGTQWQAGDASSYYPLNLYAATKQAFEDIIDYYSHHRGINAVTIRLCDIYGPIDPRPKLISLLLKIEKSKEELSMSPGNQLIFPIHIQDVLHAYRVVIDNIFNGNEEIIAKHTKYQLFPAKVLSVREFVESFQIARNIKLNIKWGGTPYRGTEIMQEPHRLESPPGWSNQIELIDGLREL